jgi:hypothetical protein
MAAKTWLRSYLLIFELAVKIQFPATHRTIRGTGAIPRIITTKTAPTVREHQRKNPHLLTIRAEPLREIIGNH